MKNDNFRPPGSFQDTTERTLILVDWSNLMYRAWFVSKEQPWIALCRFFDMLRLCVHKCKQPGVPVEIIFAGESPTKLRRTQIVEEYHPSINPICARGSGKSMLELQQIVETISYTYKGTRKPNKSPEFAQFRRDLRDILNGLGYKIVEENGAEADDVIASIVAANCHRCYCKVPCADCEHEKAYRTDIVIFSGDRDLQQLLAWKRVLIYRAPGAFVDKEVFETEYDIPVAKYGVYKALIGDKSDNILGVEGFGPVKAQIAIKANCVAEDIWELGGEKAAEQFKLALKLVNLDTKLEIGLDNLYVGAPKINEKGLLDQFDKRVLFEIKRFKEEFK